MITMIRQGVYRQTTTGTESAAELKDDEAKIERLMLQNTLARQARIVEIAKRNRAKLENN